jgi:hypothetical protein
MKRSSSAPAALGAAEGRAALLGAGVQHRDRGVAVGQQRDLGRQRVDLGHLAQHAGLVDHRRAGHHALAGAAVDEDLARIRVTCLVQQFGRHAADLQRGLQVQQGAQALVLGGQLLGAGGALALARQLLAGGGFAGLGVLDALQVAQAVVQQRHRHLQRLLQRQQRGGQRGAHRLSELPAGVG